VNFQQRVRVNAPAEKLWGFVMDVPQVAACVPGVSGVEVVDPATGKYRGKLAVSVGPIRLTLEGDISIEPDAAGHTATMHAEARDRRLGGGVHATMKMALEPADGATDLVITTDATFLGKLGDFGQPVIRKKADGILDEFGRNLRARLEG
jgi:carbon monoxide dehydrogenase subunit G